MHHGNSLRLHLISINGINGNNYFYESGVQKMIFKLSKFLTFSLALFFSCAGTVSAITLVEVSLRTGSDDLRGGNSAFIAFDLMDGTRTEERQFSAGDGAYVSRTEEVFFTREFSASDIRAVRIRHDGNPRSGHPFETYDNWNLNRISIRVGGVNAYNSLRDSKSGAVINDNNILLKRFTGESKTLRLFTQPFVSLESDIYIQSITRSATGEMQVRVGNSGGINGRITKLVCVTYSSEQIKMDERILAPGVFTTYLGWARPTSSALVTCVVTGVPETNTSNNRMTVVLF
jgi:hypothetical protein